MPTTVENDARRRKKAAGTIDPERFDAGYFDRFYGDPKTRVSGLDETRNLVRGVVSLARFWGLPIRSALDLGAGVGRWKTCLEEEAPGIRYVGVDVSEVACERYGHLRRDVSRWKTRERFDLVICQGVLQYLGDEDAERAIDNMGAMAGGLLYLEVLTKRDVSDVVDRTRSDVDVNLRSGAWYRKRLAKHFDALGCGIFHAKTAGAVFFELERGR